LHVFRAPLCTAKDGAVKKLTANQKEKELEFAK
jgi:hypothetical protein